MDGPKHAEAVAREVGRNAQEYLDECFAAGDPALAPDKFEAVPKVCVADLNIIEHIGKGESGGKMGVVGFDGA